MIKATLKLATFTVLSSVLLQSSLPVGAIPNQITQVKNQNTESANPKTKNDLPGNWSVIYDVTDKIARANGQATTPWRLAVVSQDVSNSHGSNTIFLQSSAVENLASDRSALACLISQEMGHFIKQHKPITEEE
jgi:beta-barrel assembly-enhancing protease